MDAEEQKTELSGKLESLDVEELKDEIWAKVGDA